MSASNPTLLHLLTRRGLNDLSPELSWRASSFAWETAATAAAAGDWGSGDRRSRSDSEDDEEDELCALARVAVDAFESADDSELDLDLFAIVALIFYFCMNKVQ